MGSHLPGEERVLVSAARRGDGAAFEVLARTHAPAIRGILRGMGASREDAEDALQEAWIAAHRALPAFRGDASFKSWVARIATNAYHDLRRATRRLLRPADATAPRDRQEVADPADRLARRETVERVLAAFIDLPPRQRETLRLRVVEGLGYDEIAGRLDVGRDAVRMNLIEARRKLLRRFEGDLS